MESKAPIIRVFHVYKRYGAQTALGDITLDIGQGEFIFVTGASGAGKTTLLKLLYLGEPVSEGHILVDGMNLSRIRKDRIPFLRRLFGVIFQDYNLIPNRTVFENISLVLEVAGHRPALITKKVASVLRAVGLEDRMHAYPPSLSGGEQQKITIARAIAGDPKIILADEPTGSLDEESAEDIMNLLRTLHHRGATVLIATHDRDLVRGTPARRIHLSRGRLEQEAVES
ncbi:cell division ATP-binding protein FtsE [Desulfosudis oleivorans]|uniref:Cell division ATP-binding protein FtsE n=1 Tax=Desulfosudis oleivorans (strain DSM 6200 / JCM 39069 / Hxd3) TaxID=96561 RepID=A8ZW20_DESOH|nr:cell division ATP-binding protein FtsE [Desulfosudis oleivorans]ABW68254.1 cell division ATP-binding protein FtsE [Desulfosudis oleivorans Hxd3]